MTNYIANTPAHILFAIFIFAFVVVVTGAAFISTAVGRKRARDRATLVRSIRNHPAGRNVLITPENTRNRDRAGYDWTSDIL